MHNRDLDQLLKQAISATDAFVEVLSAEELPGWAARFAGIASMLRQGDIRGAVYSLSNCSFGGPGSLSDVFAKDQRLFDRAWSVCATSIRALGKV
jgi:hypothetical protein